MDFLLEWIRAYWSVLVETSPFLLLGLVLAGILHVLVPPRVILWALGGGGFRGAVKGSLLGIPLPLCSCSVIPTALTLRRQGASLSATTSFTISTPETSIDALAITFALLPAAYIGIRPAAAILLAIMVGLCVEWFSVSRKQKLREDILKFSSFMDGKLQKALGKKKAAEVCRVCGLMEEPRKHTHGFKSQVDAISKYAFDTFFRDIAVWLILGLVLAALLQVLIPDSGFRSEWWQENPGFQVFLAIFVGIPLYSCATATTPLAAVLLMKGIDPGAALALLLAGPATNVANVFAWYREFGKRVTIVYYAALAIFCWILGMAVHYGWGLFGEGSALTEIPEEAGMMGMAHYLPHWLSVTCALIIIALTIRVLTRKEKHCD